jgi:cardiolipin synthase A/B
VSVPAYKPTARAIELRDGNLLDQALTRAAGTPLVAGNSVRLLKDAADNYPAWLAAIRSAQRTIHFENYFIVEDEIGLEFADALASKARDGVGVRLIYDWMGGFGKASRRFWKNLRDAGVDVRCFNPPSVVSPFKWLHRDHRKVLAVDGRIGFVTGLCVGKMWTGDPERGVEAWRDTGVQVEGPALHYVEAAFSQVWNVLGDPLPVEEQPSAIAPGEVGDVSLRIVANAPGTAATLRLDQIIAAAACRTLWLTDAYFAGIPPYVQALRAAALDGVDVRLLVPGASDIPILRPLSQAGFRPLLEAGIRVFEWKGPMLHAKTAVADGRWARVGSSNLNVASWIGNYELDCVVENEPFAAAMEAMYENDLQNATEVVLRPTRRGTGLRVRPGTRAEGAQGAAAHRSGAAGSTPEPTGQPAGIAHGAAPPPFVERRAHPRTAFVRSGRGSASRAAAGALRVTRAVGAALTEQRVLGPAEAQTLALAAALLVIITVVAVLWPRILAIPIAVLCVWSALALLIKAHTLRKERRAREAAEAAARQQTAP